MAEAAAAAAARLERISRFRFDQFDHNIEEFEYYIQRFELQLIRFGISSTEPNDANARQRLLLSHIGAEAFKMLVNHFKPAAIISINYENLKEALKSYYGTQICTTAERVKFTQRTRNVDETITVRLNTLRAIGSNCQFGDALNERLRDQLVIGINNDSWQQELFRSHPNNDATLEQVEATARAFEKAVLQQQRLQSLGNGKEGTTIGRVQKKSFPKKGKETATTGQVQEGECNKCGLEAHEDEEGCPAIGKICHACGKADHFCRVCKGRAKFNKQQRFKKINALRVDDADESEQTEEEEDSFSGFYAISDVNKQGWQAHLNTVIDGHNVKMMFDSGAAYSVVSRATWVKIGSPTLTQTEALVAYTQVPVETLGKTSVTVTVFGQTKKLEVQVVTQHDTPLFGLDWCIAFGLELPKGVIISKVARSASDQTSSNHGSPMMVINGGTIYSGTDGGTICTNGNSDNSFMCGGPMHGFEGFDDTRVQMIKRIAISSVDYALNPESVLMHRSPDGSDSDKSNWYDSCTVAKLTKRRSFFEGESDARRLQHAIGNSNVQSEVEYVLKQKQQRKTATAPAQCGAEAENVANEEQRRDEQSRSQRCARSDR